MRKFFFMLFMPMLAFSQTPEIIKVRAYRAQSEKQLLDDFKEFISIPNIASDLPNIKKNADWIMKYMAGIGIENIQLLNSVTENQPPVVFGEVKVSGAQETLVLYAHYDGQPVDSTKWAKGLHPFRPQLANGSLASGGALIDWSMASNSINADWRIYGRGASDDKAGVFAILHAYAALKKNGLQPKVNLKFFFEGEEEAGSTHLHEIFDRYKSLIAGDIWVICDGPVHQSSQKQVVFGVRGDTHLELTVFGPKRPLHSGHYGNWIPNPAMEMSRLLASMKNEKGQVTIDGFYDDLIPLTPAEKSALSKLPPVEEQLKKELGVRKPERDALLNETLNLPSLNINGFQAAGVGKYSANVIPTHAIASIDLRLVAGNDWKRQQQKVIDHIEKMGFKVLDHEPTDQERATYDRICMVKRSDGYNAQKTKLDDPFAQRIVRAVSNALPKPVLQLPTLGGSLPLFVFEQKLNAHPVTVPIANHDNNQHAENENIRIGNLWDGIEMFASIMLLGK